LLNKDRVSKEFISWNVEFGDYVIEFSCKKSVNEVSEHMYVLKSHGLTLSPECTDISSFFGINNNPIGII
ncbi:hypothetical protein DRN43_04885, partial [Thermococci archaeon]